MRAVKVGTAKLSMGLFDMRRVGSFAVPSVVLQGLVPKLLQKLFGSAKQQQAEQPELPGGERTDPFRSGRAAVQPFRKYVH